MSKFYAKYLIEKLQKEAFYFLIEEFEFARHVYKLKICENENDFDYKKIKQALELIGYSPNQDEF